MIIYREYSLMVFWQLNIKYPIHHCNQSNQILKDICKYFQNFVKRKRKKPQLTSLYSKRPADGELVILQNMETTIYLWRVELKSPINLWCSLFTTRILNVQTAGSRKLFTARNREMSWLNRSIDIDSAPFRQGSGKTADS